MFWYNYFVFKIGKFKHQGHWKSPTPIRGAKNQNRNFWIPIADLDSPSKTETMFSLQFFFILMSSWWKMRKTIKNSLISNLPCFYTVFCIFQREDAKIKKSCNENMFTVFEGLFKSAIGIQKFQFWFFAYPIGVSNFQWPSCLNLLILKTKKLYQTIP